MKNKLAIAFSFLFGLWASALAQKAPPNIIVILADDMGYSDLGCMGSEIQTPNLDQLAGNGVLFTHCYNTSRCCPSRASLLTGLYQHRVGIGDMSQDRGYPEYQGYLNQQCMTIAEVLQGKGYRTVMAGKWHVGGERPQWPDRRGFDQFFGIPQGGGLYFYPTEFIDRPIYRNGEPVTPDSSTFYSTDNFTDEAIQFIRDAQDEQQPFFLYLAYIAPHFPLQAWPKDIAKYDGAYDTGYETIRQQRFQRQQQLGIVSTKLTLSPADYAAWNSLEEPGSEAHKMEVYAAQVDRMDQNIGKLVDALKDMGSLDNTVILFLSDNGASSEEVNRAPDAELGTVHSFASYGKNWANVSNTPYRLYKSMTHEGGILTPLIVHWPKGIQQHQLIDQPVHINDIMPTCLELAGANYPAQYQGHNILPLDGKSFASALNGKVSPHEQLFWEHEGNQAIREQDRKLVRRFEQSWELYDLANDPTELHDLSQTDTETAERMKKQYQEWMEQHGVRPWPVKNNENP
ncbi:MAG: arylsulfatase [Cyclobacteriaceae bacterium]